jgi:hypothetical protein
MSLESTEPAAEETNGGISTKIQTDREEALAQLSDVTEEARYKSIGGGRIRNPEHERVRLKYLRLIIQAQSERRKLLADYEIEDLKNRLERLEGEYE